MPGFIIKEGPVAMEVGFLQNKTMNSGYRSTLRLKNKLLRFQYRVTTIKTTGSRASR